MAYPATQTYWLDGTDLVQLGLRRYVSGSSEHTCEGGYHSALVITELTWPANRDEKGYLTSADEVDHADPRWPLTCEHCPYAFTDEDVWQPWQDALYRRSDTGELVALRDAPPGACWDAWWLPNSWAGPDGVKLMVKCPNGREWMVDARASNCTRPDEPHQCWVRHGDPRECRITVDKNGDTCAAGAGSILAGDYHGFLINGVLTAG